MDNNLIALNEKLTAIAENEQRVFEAGKAKQECEWWERYQSIYVNGNRLADRNNYLYAFAGTGWDDTTYNPIRTIKPSANAQNIFSLSNITDTKVDVDLAYGGTTPNCINVFTNARALVTVRKLIVDELTNMANQFTSCAALENLTIEGTIGQNFNAQWCPLTEESILSVVTHLSDTTSGLTCTFKSTAVEAAFTTEEWNALVATKPNWTFAKA